MLYQLNYIHHLWDDKGSAFFGKSPNFFFHAVWLRSAVPSLPPFRYLFRYLFRCNGRS